MNYITIKSDAPEKIACSGILVEDFPYGWDISIKGRIEFFPKGGWHLVEIREITPVDKEICPFCKRLIE